jgi:hypothetical protein
MSNVSMYLYSLFFTFVVIVLVTTLYGCTISFQNISTHGVATDLGDDELSASPTVSPNINIPAI